MNKFKKIFLIIAVCICSSAYSVVEKNNFDLNDVSYLLPLPRTITHNVLQPIQRTVGAQYLEKLPRLSMLIPNNELFPKMHAVAIRLDPVNKQIRSVWQPIVVGPKFSSTTLDMAFHSFHQLNENDFRLLIIKLKNWKIKSLHQPEIKVQPLGVHPLLSQYENSVQIELQKIFFDYCSDKNLAKLTAMVLRGNEDMWAFMGIEKNSTGQFEPILIARTPNHMAQSYVNAAVPFETFDHAQMSGIGNSVKDNLNIVIKQIAEGPAFSEDEIKSAFQTVNRIENPKYYSEDQLDCVHCHVSQSIRQVLDHKFSDQTLLLTDKYFNANFDLSNLTERKLNTRQIRGFGYFGSSPAISQRVINDSAEAASWLNQDFK